MKKYILAGILLCVMALCGCVQAEPVKKPSAEQEVAMKTVEGREAFIEEELYEGAKILSEIKNEETGFIVSEFSAGDLHSFVFFRPTEKGYDYNGDAEETLKGMVTEAYSPMGDGEYHVFLRHSDDIVSLDVTYFSAETNEVLQEGTVTFEEGDLVLMPFDEEKINYWWTRIVAHDKDGQEYVLCGEEPPAIDMHPLEKTERRMVRKLIFYIAGIAVVYAIGEKRRKK